MAKPHQPIGQIGVVYDQQGWQQIFVYLPYDKFVNFQLLLMVKSVWMDPESIDMYINIALRKILLKTRGNRYMRK